jgi:hypothetical protein
MGGTRATGLVVLGLGFAASATAVVLGFDDLIHGNKIYLAVTSMIGLVAFGAGLQMLLSASRSPFAQAVHETLLRPTFSPDTPYVVFLGDDKRGRIFEPLRSAVPIAGHYGHGTAGLGSRPEHPTGRSPRRSPLRPPSRRRACGRSSDRSSARPLWRSARATRHLTVPGAGRCADGSPRRSPVGSRRGPLVPTAAPRSLHSPPGSCAGCPTEPARSTRVSSGYAWTGSPSPNPTGPSTLTGSSTSPALPPASTTCSTAAPPLTRGLGVQR